jgi:broad specificity phosphatase PhoE
VPTLLLIRHGENDYFAHNKLPGHNPNIHLNKRGLEQAEELERTLNKLPIKVVYASPLERAVETASPLARSLGMEVQLKPGLADIDVGAWTGRSWRVLSRTKQGKLIQETPSRFQFPDGESFVQVQERVVTVLDSMAVAHKDELVAVVFHADPIKLAVAHYLGLPLDQFQRFVIFPGSVTVLRLDGSNVRLLALNLIPPFTIPHIK